MKILITGICGFVGKTLAGALRESIPNLKIIGLDNLVRPGSETNRLLLKKNGITLQHADIRNRSDLETLPPADWIIDAAANPSVLAGLDGKTSTRQLMEHNLCGTINVLELFAQWRCGLIMLSTSRVYSIPALSQIALEVKNKMFVPSSSSQQPKGLTLQGLTEEFSTEPPLSFYGTTKLSSELLAREYASAFNLPLWINRCGVMAGAGQFGKAEQGIFSFWIHSYCQRKPLTFIGFQGHGYQVRDCLHPLDLAPLIVKQMKSSSAKTPQTINLAGGIKNCMSLAQLTDWCRARFGQHAIAAQPANRPHDVPWLVLNTNLAHETWKWAPTSKLETILEEIAQHAEQNPHWLDLTGDEMAR